MKKNELFRKLPGVDRIFNIIMKKQKYKDIPRKIITDCIRETIDTYRNKILIAGDNGFSVEENIIVLDVERLITKKWSNSFKRVINATGTVLHTNLGRAPLSAEIKERFWDVVSNYSNLEIDLATGTRGSRYSHVESLLCDLTGAEAALVVNNNAGAVLLVLSALASGREVIISRGQLVEIGGSFRIPEVMAQSGARLVEVGTTNRTHLKDYENFINENTGALLKVHTSNYKICGFTKVVESRELVSLGEKYKIPVIEDLGSGSMIDFSKYGLTKEPTVIESVKAGVDVVTFSGDKLLGGPQAGIVLGKKEYIEVIKKHPLNRALRIDKMTLAALEFTLRLYLDENKAVEKIPVLKMLTAPLSKLEEKAKLLFKELEIFTPLHAKIEIVSEFSMVGGGAYPVEKLPTKAVILKPIKFTVTELDQMLRELDIPIITRISDDCMVFDVRTMNINDFSKIRTSLEKIFFRKS